MKNRLSLLVACSSFMAGLAALLAILPLSFSFPLIPYLKFDLAEIPIILAFLLLGPKAGAISSIVYWLVLLLVGSYTPLGPTMKFIAVGMLVLGFWLGFKLSRNGWRGLLLGSLIGCALRVGAMTLLNYLVLAFVFPEFLEIAVASISTILGLRFSSGSAALFMVMALTAVFNILHTILSIVPAYLLIRSLAGIGGSNPRIGRIWYLEISKAASRRPPRRS